MPTYKLHPGKILHKGTAVVITAIRSAYWANWYRLCWKIGRNCRMAGSIRRRAYSGDATFGRDCDLGHGLVIDVARQGKLVVGDGVSINAGTFLSVLESVVIGDHTRIGEYCSIRDNDHKYSDSTRLITEQGMAKSSIMIGRDVWIGRNVCVQRGVSIGDGAVIGANSFVNRDVPAMAIAVGTPARIIGHRGGT